MAIILFFIATILFFLQLVNFYSSNLTEELPLPVKQFNSQTVKIDAHSPLFNTALFGQYVPILSDNQIKQSSLDLEVIGIMYSSDKINSQVLIRAAGGEEELYKIGDNLPGGAIIKKINKQGIVVFYKGELERLSLPKNELLFDKPAKALIKE